MSWTRLDDLWTERADLSHATRWHLLSMIQRCSRSDLRDGVMRIVDAHRCSDHPDPTAALTELGRAGLIEKTGDTTLRVIGIDAYLPSEATRQRTANNRMYQQRSRERKQLHARGDHSLCPADRCGNRTQKAPVSADVSTQVSADVGTGRDWTASVPSRDGTDIGRARENQGAALATPRGGSATAACPTD